MSPEYASTFAAGFKREVQRALEEHDPEVYMQIIQSGLVLYTSRLSPEEIGDLPFFNNTFLILSNGQFADTTNMERVVDSLFRNVRLRELKEGVQSLGARSFRFMVSRENQTQPISAHQRAKMEAVVSRSLGISVDRNNPDTEVWFLTRRDGLGFCDLRLTRRERAERGELRREVSYVLNSISEPRGDDVFLDPFAGSGAIPLARARYFPYARIIAMDNDPENVEEIRQRLRKFPRTQVTMGNALHMRELQDRSINVVVTDPPWGIFRKLDLDPDEFHSIMLGEIYSINFSTLAPMCEDRL